MSPPWLNDPSSLVLVDWSWWCARALHGSDGVDGMLPRLVGWLTTHLLAWEPAHLALALDSPGETWRHRLRHPSDETWRYKAHRPPKPPQFSEIVDVATRIVELHGIPCLWADGYEADDVIATATAKARAAGYRVWIATADKDLAQLVERDAHSGVTVALWNPFPGESWSARGPEQVREAYGVEPSQIADWLAISGDGSDGVPGVGHGLGPTRAAAILARYGTLAEALAAPVWSSTKFEEIDRAISDIPRMLRRGTWTEEARANLLAKREDLKRDRQIERWRLTLVAHRGLAEFSRELTALDCDAPVDMPWEELPLGGYQVEELRRVYTAHGFTRKAAEVPLRSKRAPWAMPWTSKNVRPCAAEEAACERSATHGGQAPRSEPRTSLPPSTSPRPRSENGCASPVGSGATLPAGGSSTGGSASGSSRPGGSPSGDAAPSASSSATRGAGPLCASPSRERGTPHPLLLAAAKAAEQMGCIHAAGVLLVAAQEGADPALVARTVLRPAQEMDGVDVERIAQERQARLLVEQAITPLGVRYAIEDLERKDRFRALDPKVRRELLDALKAKKGAAA